MKRLDRLALLCACALLPLSTQAKWTEASSRHFVIYSEDKPEELRVFAEQLERYDQAMRLIKGMADPEIGPANRLNVYAVRNVSAVQRLANDKGRNLVGFYIGRASGSSAVVPRKGTGGGQYDLDAQSVLFHEYAHHFLFSNYSVAWPAWLSEGYAEFHAAAEIKADGSVQLGLPALHRAYSLMSIPPVPMARMMTLTTDASRTEVASLYARGWLLIHHLTFEPKRRGQLTAYLQGLENGSGSVDAATAAFGDLRALDSDLDRYVRRRRLPAVQVAASELKVPDIALRELTPGENAVLPLRIRSKLGVDPKEARELVPLVRTAAEPFANDAMVQVTLAEAEFDAQNPAAAEAAADRALAADPKLVDAYVYKGRARMALAQLSKDGAPDTWKQVRHWFVSANRIDPEDPEPLILFYLSFDAVGDRPTANAIAGLQRAMQLAPQDRRLRMIGAYEYLYAGKAPEARKLLTLVASDPHAGEVAKNAVTLLGKLDESGTDAALNDFDRRLLSW